MIVGELISLGVAVSWTFSAIFMEYASKKLGAIQTNAIRLSLAVLINSIFLFIATGNFFIIGANLKVWIWMGISGLIGYVIGDFCLFYSYVIIGALYGQLFMTLAPLASTIAGAVLLGERISTTAYFGIAITVSGICLSIHSRNKNSHSKARLSTKGIMSGIIAGTCQGVGLVFSKYGITFYHETANFDTFLIPFEAGQIRMIVGALAFTSLLLFSGKIKTITPAFTSKKMFFVIIGGTIFGPFVGVSFSLLAVQYTASGIASTIMALTPILIIPFTIFVQKQKVAVTEIIGAFISVFGVSLFFI